MYFTDGIYIEYYSIYYLFIMCCPPPPPPPPPSPNLSPNPYPHQTFPISPSSVITCKTSKIINKFCDYIESIIQDTNWEELDQLSKIFANKNKLAISFRDYIEYLFVNVERNDRTGENTIIYIIFLLTRLRQKGISINYYNLVSIILILFILATKLLDDDAYTNRDWANLFMLQTNEINSMEMELLKILNYDIFIREEHIKHIMKCIV